MTINICPGYGKNPQCKETILKGQKSCGSPKCRAHAAIETIGPKKIKLLNRHRQITGKLGEFKVIGKLLNEGYPVYTPVMDIEGVDCIIRNSGGDLVEIQVKSSGEAKRPFYFVFKWNKKSKPNYYFIFYINETGDYWIIPSEYLTGKERKKINGPDKNGYCSIDLGTPKHREMYKEFKNNWDSLR